MEYCFEELGYFTPGDIRRIAEVMNGRTFMNFKVTCSNQAGNCVLIVKTDYDGPEADVKSIFLHAALAQL